MSIHLLNKKGWHVWNRDNIEKVKRDERLHSEEENRKAESEKLANSEHRLATLRKKASGLATEPALAVAEDALKRRREDSGPVAPKKQAIPPIRPPILDRRDLGSDTKDKLGQSIDLRKRQNLPQERTFRDIFPETDPWYTSQTRRNQSNVDADAFHTSQKEASNHSNTNIYDPMYNLQSRLAKQRELRAQEMKNPARSPISSTSIASHWTPLSTREFTSVLKDSRPSPRTAHPFITRSSAKSESDSSTNRDNIRIIKADHEVPVRHHSGSYIEPRRLLGPQVARTVSNNLNFVRDNDPSFRDKRYYSYNSSSGRNSISESNQLRTNRHEYLRQEEELPSKRHKSDASIKSRRPFAIGERDSKCNK